uniref:ABC transporter ATP-binding protein n=1 Tax=Thermofilum pendens TaxID=2269 RepID=A0A7C4FCM8_THEPE
MRVVEVRGLKWRYRGSRAPVLRGVNLEVEKGEFLAVTGPSGAGKTTLVLALTGVIPQRLPGEMEGEVRVLGMSTLEVDVTEIAKRVAVVFEDPEIQFVMSTVEDEIALSLEARGLSREEIRERILWALELVGLGEEFLERQPHQLSGGEKQRVAIAAAVAREPELLILDEPTSDLDPRGKEEVVEAIESVRESLDATVIMVEHEPELIEKFADRLVVLDDGMVVMEGVPQEVYSRVEEAKRHAAYPPEDIELAVQLGLKPPARRDLLELAMLSSPLDGLCVFPGSRGGEVVISARDVWYTYPGGVEALRGVSLELRRGELAALMGPNGSGKTTLAKVLAGLLKPSRGEVRVAGRPIAEYSRLELSSLVGYVYQNPQHQLFCQSVFEEVAFGLRLRGVKGEELEQRVSETLCFFELEELRDEHPFFLSKGEKRRLALASVYALRPELLIVDEPTTGQDRRFGEQLMGVLRQLADSGKSVLVITHSVDLALKYADRLIAMSRGRVIADAHPLDVLSDAEIVGEAKLKRPLKAELCAIARRRRRAQQ